MSRQQLGRLPRGSRWTALDGDNKENFVFSSVNGAKKRRVREPETEQVMETNRFPLRNALMKASDNRMDNSAFPANGSGNQPNQALQSDMKPPDVSAVEVPLSEVDINNLLSEKMVLKNKNDYKKKCELQTEYIKKLRDCIRGIRRRESEVLEELKSERLQKAEQEERHREAVSSLDMQLAKSASSVTELQGTVEDREKSLEVASLKINELETAKEAIEVTLRLEKAQTEKLSSELSIAQGTLTSLNDKVKALETNNQSVQAYNKSLQDYNGKLQGEAATARDDSTKLTQEKSDLMEELATIRGRVSYLDAQLLAAERKDQAAQVQLQEHSLSVERLQKQLSEAFSEMSRLNEMKDKLAEENASYKEVTGRTAEQAKEMKSKANALEESFVTQEERMLSLHQDLEKARHRVEMLERFSEAKNGDIASLRTQVAALETKLLLAEQQILEGEAIRRSLHNTIQELKGNIRVFCRVRPLSVEEEGAAEDGTPVVQYPTGADVTGRAIDLVQPQGPKYSFTYDKVFGPQASQNIVFQEIEQLVQSALDGYRVCIFAYGQTGSGKTHTMLGQPDDEQQRGVIPRSLEKIFDSKQVAEEKGWQFSMQASMLEIYNETIRDLLVNPARASCIGAAPSADNKLYAVKHDAGGNTHVSDLTLVDVNNKDEVSMLISKAAKGRSVAKTAMNDRSSRSHCVFTLRIMGVNMATDQRVNGVLNLIDLSGSERLSRSGATGDRLKETQAINKSLSALGDVICAIANKESHVPYRNSKLTYLLQPCLGGDAKTLMFVNVAPTKQSLNESLCALRFAAKVNACEIGVPRRQAVHPIEA